MLNMIDSIRLLFLKLRRIAIFVQKINMKKFPTNGLGMVLGGSQRIGLEI